MAMSETKSLPGIRTIFEKKEKKKRMIQKAKKLETNALAIAESKVNQAIVMGHRKLQLKRYHRSVVKGRHPRSFPAKSNLSSFIHNAEERVSLLQAGQNARHVVKQKKRESLLASLPVDGKEVEQAVVQQAQAENERNSSPSRPSTANSMPIQARRHARGMFKGVLATSFFRSPLRYVSDAERQKHRASLLSMEGFDEGHARMRRLSSRAESRYQRSGRTPRSSRHHSSSLRASERPRSRPSSANSSSTVTPRTRPSSASSKRRAHSCDDASVQQSVHSFDAVEDDTRSALLSYGKEHFVAMPGVKMFYGAMVAFEHVSTGKWLTAKMTHTRTDKGVRLSKAEYCVQPMESCGPQWQYVFKLVNLKAPKDASRLCFGNDVWICLDEGSKEHCGFVVGTRSRKAVNLIELEDEQRFLQQAGNSSSYRSSSRPSTSAGERTSAPAVSASDRPATAPKSMHTRFQSKATAALANAAAEALVRQHDEDVKNGRRGNPMFDDTRRRKVQELHRRAARRRSMKMGNIIAARATLHLERGVSEMTLPSAEFNTRATTIGRWKFRNAVADKSTSAASSKSRKNNTKTHAVDKLDSQLYNGCEVFLEQDWFYVASEQDDGGDVIIRTVPSTFEAVGGDNPQSSEKYAVPPAGVWRLHLVEKPRSTERKRGSLQEMETLLYTARHQLVASEAQRGGAQVHDGNIASGEKFARQLRESQYRKQCTMEAQTLVGAVDQEKTIFENVMDQDLECYEDELSDNERRAHERVQQGSMPSGAGRLTTRQLRIQREARRQRRERRKSARMIQAAEDYRRWFLSQNIEKVSFNSSQVTLRVCFAAQASCDLLI